MALMRCLNTRRIIAAAPEPPLAVQADLLRAICGCT